MSSPFLHNLVSQAWCLHSLWDLFIPHQVTRSYGYRFLKAAGGVAHSAQHLRPSQKP